MNDDWDPSAPTRLAVSESDEGVRLAIWATAVARSFVRAGLSPDSVPTVASHALETYDHFKASVQEPRVFVARRIAAIVNQQRHALGLDPVAGPISAVPHLFDVALTNAALELLPYNLRRTIEMLFGGSRATYDDIARELDVSVPYAEYLANKAVAQLKQWLPPEWPEE